MDRVRTVLESDLNQSAKLIALALVADVPVMSIGLSGTSLKRHEDAARKFVDQMPRAVDAPAPRPRERADATAIERFMRAQERDLRDSLRTRKPDVVGTWGPGDPYRG
jgi:primosomal protein N''